MNAFDGRFDDILARPAFGADFPRREPPRSRPDDALESVFPILVSLTAALGLIFRLLLRFFEQISVGLAASVPAGFSGCVRTAKIIVRCVSVPRGKSRMTAIFSGG